MSSSSSSSSSSHSSESKSTQSSSSINKEQNVIEQPQEQEIEKKIESKQSTESSKSKSSSSEKESTTSEDKKEEVKEEVKEEIKEEQPVVETSPEIEEEKKSKSSTSSKSSKSSSDEEQKEDIKEETKEEQIEEEPKKEESKSKSSTSSKSSKSSENKEQKEEIKEVKEEPKKEEKKSKSSTSSKSSKSSKDKPKEEMKKDKHKKKEKKSKSKKEKKEKIIMIQETEKKEEKKSTSSSSSEDKIIAKKQKPIKVIGEASHPNKPLSPFIIPSPFEDIPENIIDPITDLKPIKGIHKKDKERLSSFNSNYKDNIKTLLPIIEKLATMESNIYFQQKQKEANVSCKQFYEEIQKNAQSYIKLKEKHRGVLFIAKNHWKQFAMAMGCIMAGMYVVYANPKTPITDIAEMIKQAGIVQIVTDIDGKDVIKDILTVTKIQCVLVDGVVHDDLYTSYDDFIKKGNKKRDKLEKIKERMKSIANSLEPTDIAEIVFVQGEKGIHGIMWTHGNIISECNALIERFAFGNTTKYVMTSHLSFYLERIFTLYLPMIIGYQVYIPIYPLHNEGLQPFFTVCKEFKPTLIVGIPRFYEKIVKKAEQIIGDEKKQEKAKKMGIKGILKEEQGSSKPRGYGKTRKFVYNPIKEELGLMNVELFLCSDQMQKETIENVMGIGITVYCGLSLPETTGFCAINYELNMNIETAGKPLGTTTFESEGKSELVISGPTVAGGYIEKGFGKTGFNSHHIGALIKDENNQNESYVKITQLNPQFIHTTNHEQVSIQQIEKMLKKISVVKNVLVIGTDQTFITCIFTVVYDIAKQKLMEKCPSKETFLKDPHFGSYVRQRIDRINKQLPIPIQVKKFAFIEEGSEHSKFVKEKMTINEREASLQYFSKLIDSLYQRGGRQTQTIIDPEKEKEIQKQRQKEEKERLKEEKRIRKEKRELEKAKGKK